MSFKNPPECDKPTECRIEGGISVTTTLAYFPTLYDRSGELVSAPWEGNKTTTSWHCVTCGKSWSE
jgi:hypothetical protein